MIRISSEFLLVASPAMERQAAPMAGNVTSGLGGPLDDEDVAESRKDDGFGRPQLPEDLLMALGGLGEAPMNKVNRH